MTDTTPEAVERLARVLDGPFYRVEGYAGPYIDEATLRDEHTAAAATLRAQQAEIARLTVERDAALAQVSAWQPIATAPRDETLFLATGLDGGNGPDRHVAIVFCDGAGFFDDYDEYTYLTHWMPLPAPPVDSSAAPSTPVDNKISADPVGKEG